MYNGNDALPVRLDEIRWLDWALQRDLAIVLLGTGNAGFEDSHIRKAFHEVGGDAAVDWFHWHTTGGPHRNALDRLARAAANAPKNGRLLEVLQALATTNAKTDLSGLRYLPCEQGSNIATVLDGPWGHHRGVLSPEAITAAIATWRERAVS